MPNFAPMAVAMAAITFAGGCAVTIEKAEYTVVEKDRGFEIRDYAPHVVAETVVDGQLEEAGNKAFGRLFRYISGDNRAKDKIAMTAPVSQTPQAQKIAMTAPVGQQRVEGGWVVSFVMPAEHTMQTLPEPTDPQVKLRQVQAQRMAAVRYSGVWSEKRYLTHKQGLESWIETKKLKTTGEPVWARYNPPFTPWFMRRNEVLIAIASDTD